jgi:acetyl esterase/lipase
MKIALRTATKYYRIGMNKEQHDAILDRQGHESCPGVEIEFKHPLGAAPDGGPELLATVFRPVDRPTQPAPVLLAYHGGGYHGGNPNGCGAIAKQLALTLGVTTVAAAYRLATDTTPSYPGILADAAHAYRWILKHASELNIDPKRIIVCGESAGVIPAAHLAVASPLIGFTDDEPRPAAFIAQWGCMDFVARWFDLNENPSSERGLLGAGYDQNPQLYFESSPIAYATGSLPPALFIYGRQDPIVHARQGRLGHAAWQAAGAHSELNILNNIGHHPDGDNREQRADCLATVTGFVAARL